MDISLSAVLQFQSARKTGCDVLELLSRDDALINVFDPLCDIKVWSVPKASFGHTRVCTFREHKRAITALSLTKAHLFSASDEGHVRIWSLGTLCLQRVSKQDFWQTNYRTPLPLFYCKGYVAEVLVVVAFSFLIRS